MGIGGSGLHGSLTILYRKYNSRREIARPEDSLCRREIIRVFCFENTRRELLGIAVNQRKPRALNLHHDLVPFLKGMISGMKIDAEVRRLIRDERFRMFEALIESSPEDFVGDDQLVAAQVRMRHRLNVVFRVDIDQLHDPIAICP